MKLWICCKHISEIIEITTCRETPPESLLNATRSVSNKMVLNLNRSVENKLLLFYCLYYLINIISMTTKMCSEIIHGLLRIKFCLFVLELEIRMTFKYTECSIFLNSEKHNKSNCTKKIVCCY
jgi:hypothetical protein